MLLVLILFIIALVSNTLSALAGGGAGLLQLPAILFLGLPFPVALATHKIASVALGVGASLRHLNNTQLKLSYALAILAFGLPGVVLGARIVVDIPEDTAKLALGILTIGLGLYSFFKADLGHEESPKHRDKAGWLIGGIILFFIGALNGSLTSGTGLFVTLWLVYWFGFDYKQAVAYTLVLVGLFWNGTGALTLGIISEIKWEWLPSLIAGSLIGGYLGAHLSIIKGNRLIKRMFEVVTVAVGVSLIISVIAV